MSKASEYAQKAYAERLDDLAAFSKLADILKNHESRIGILEGGLPARPLHVSPTGEITGTLPCGHGVEKIRPRTESRDGHRPIVGAWCRDCCDRAIHSRSPAP